MAILSGAGDPGSRACGPLCVEKDFAQQKEAGGFSRLGTPCSKARSKRPLSHWSKLLWSEEKDQAVCIRVFMHVVTCDYICGQGGCVCTGVCVCACL